MSLTLRIKRLPHAGDLPLPAYETEGAAGLDLRAALAEPLILEPQARRLVPTGLCIELPAGHEAQVRPRSGLAIRNGITLINSPGTIDADYRGEIKVPLVNLSRETFTITHGMRMAQMVIARVEQLVPVEVENLSASGRGEGGFGSTGV